MNKSWMVLIVAGIIFLIAAVAWEAYQNFSGARSNIDVTLIEYQRSTLFSTTLEKYLTSDPTYISQLSDTKNTTDTTNTTDTQPTVDVAR